MNRALRTRMKDCSPHERLSSQQEIELEKLPSLPENPPGSMKLSTKKCLIIATALGLGLLPARTWTSADGTRTFEGKFKSYDAAEGKVSVTIRNGRTLTFSVDKLSKADQTFLTEEAAKRDGTAQNKAAMEEFSLTDIGKAFTMMQVLEGDAFIPHEFKSLPDYFILYYSASW
jgi:hypothetical protein